MNLDFRENREPFSAIIVQNEESSIIQQFREAPSAYIFFVNELIHNFIEVRQAALHLGKIFNKLKNHFWGSTDSEGGMPYVNKGQSKMGVNIEIEHMALFFHDVMKDQAIYKIMKSAQQTLDEDKAILLEYKIFKYIIKVYKRVYAYCKQCYKVALIKQKFDEPNKKPEIVRRMRNSKCCSNKHCTNCYPVPPTTQTTSEETLIEEDKQQSNKFINQNENDVRYVDEDDDDEIVDEEEEESSEDDIEFENQSGESIDLLLSEYQKVMNQKVEEEKRAEKIKQQINDLSIDEVVNMIENKEVRDSNNSNSNHTNKKNKLKKKNKNKKDIKFEEEMQKDANKEIPFKKGEFRFSRSFYTFIEKTNDVKKSPNVSDDGIKEELVIMDQNSVKNEVEAEKPPDITAFDEDQFIENLKWNTKLKARLKPNFSADWLKSLKRKTLSLIR